MDNSGREKVSHKVLIEKLIQFILYSFDEFRYALSDPRVQNIVRLITESVQVENLRFLFNLPWARHLFPESTGWNSQKKITKGIKDEWVHINKYDTLKVLPGSLLSKKELVLDWDFQ